MLSLRRSKQRCACYFLNFFKYHASAFICYIPLHVSIIRQRCGRTMYRWVMHMLRNMKVPSPWRLVHWRKSCVCPAFYGRYQHMLLYRRRTVQRSYRPTLSYYRTSRVYGRYWIDHWPWQKKFSIVTCVIRIRVWAVVAKSEGKSISNFVLRELLCRMHPLSKQKK